VRRLIEEAYTTARAVLTEHVDDLRRLADLLVDRETIDKEQFERLLAGESEDDVFVEPPSPEPVTSDVKKPRSERPATKPFPLPGALSKPPPPKGAKG